jgi:hypothetical protein
MLRLSSQAPLTRLIPGMDDPPSVTFQPATPGGARRVGADPGGAIFREPRQAGWVAAVVVIQVAGKAFCDRGLSSTVEGGLRSAIDWMGDLRDRCSCRKP